MKTYLVKGFALLICIASLLMLFGVIACTRYEGSPGCFNRPPTDFAEQAQNLTDKARETTEGLVEEGKQQLEEVTDKLPAEVKPAETPAATPAEPEPESTPQAAEEGCWMEGKWKIEVKAEEPTFAAVNGLTYSCDPFEIMFQVRDWQVEKMHSPKYGYISPDYAAGVGEVTLKRDGYLEIIIDGGMTEEELRGWLSYDGTGGGAWESCFTIDEEEYEGCFGKWEAVRTGELSE